MAVGAVGILSAAPATAAAGDPVVTVLSPGSGADPLVRVLADTGTRDPQTVAAADVSVTAGGRALPSRATRLLSDSSDVVMVLDPSPAGAAALPELQSGAADLLLQLPAGARSAAVVAGDRPRVVAPLARGPLSALAALSEVETSGRPTDAGGAASTALRLALDELGPVGGAASSASPSGSSPAASSSGTARTRPRLVVLQTTAPDAGGVPAAELAGQLRQAAVVLEVVAPPGGSAFWRAAAAPTGGTVTEAAPGTAVPAFRRVSDVLRHSFLLTFPRPSGAGALPDVSVTVGGAGAGAGATVDLGTPVPSAASPAPSAAASAAASAAGSQPSPQPSRRGTFAIVVNVLGLAVAAVGAGAAVRTVGRRPTGAHAPGAPVRHPRPSVPSPRTGSPTGEAAHPGARSEDAPH